jgi:hypothetical protein
MLMAEGDQYLSTQHFSLSARQLLAMVFGAGSV